MATKYTPHRKALRKYIFKRDDGKCAKCGSGEHRTLDHIIPLSLGGAWTECNLQCLCQRCNVRKGDRVEIWSPYINLGSLLHSGYKRRKMKPTNDSLEIFVLSVYVAPIPRGAEVLLVKEWKEGRVPMVLVKRRHGEGEVIVPREWIREPYII